MRWRGRSTKCESVESGSAELSDQGEQSVGESVVDVGAGDGRPGSGMYEVFEVMVGRLGGLIEELNGVWGGGT